MHKLLLFCLFIFAVSCNEDDNVSNMQETFLDELVAVDQEERILLYNGNDANSSQDVLSLGGEAISFVDSLDNVELGLPYSSTWRSLTYTFYKTELPIIKIRTASTNIVEEVYESSQITVIEQGQITLQSTLGIRLRGNTSLSFPKKSYRLELWNDSDGSNNRDEAILGMRSDDDWLLDGMWNEPLSIRDKSAMELWLSFGRIKPESSEEGVILGSKREYCELFIDGIYKGLYYIGERLDEEQLKLDRNTDPAQSGELYKAKGWDTAVIGFELPPFNNNSTVWSGYEVKYPDEPGSFDWGKLKTLIEFFKNEGPDNFESLYPEKIDVDNIIDYFFLINLLDAFDNSGNNIFIARKNQSLPYYFIPWDFDATAGLGIFGQVDVGSNDFIHHLVTRRLIRSASFQDQLKLRWTALRAEILSNETIKAYYHANHALLLKNGIYQREQGISRLEKSLPDADDMAYLENSLENRLQFLDVAIANL